LFAGFAQGESRKVNWEKYNNMDVVQQDNAGAVVEGHLSRLLGEIGHGVASYEGSPCPTSFRRPVAALF